MRGALYLAWRYLAYHRGKTAILVTSIALIAFLPVGLRVLVSQSAAELTARAQATPLLVGAKGSPLELVLSSLYFESDPPETTTYAEVSRIAESGLAEPIPSMCASGPADTRSWAPASSTWISAACVWPRAGPWRCLASAWWGPGRRADSG